MAAPVTQSGAMVPCPNCGTEVMQKAMIPVGQIDNVPFYLCVDCARQLVKTAPSS
jgi:DNA-directed RNA polymerase subunit RPC12/RpoP